MPPAIHLTSRQQRLNLPKVCVSWHGEGDQGKPRAEGFPAQAKRGQLLVHHLCTSPQRSTRHRQNPDRAIARRFHSLTGPVKPLVVGDEAHHIALGHTVLQEGTLATRAASWLKRVAQSRSVS